MAEEINNGIVETPAVEETPVVNEAPVVEEVKAEEPKKKALNASVAPEDFDWDAFENDGATAVDKEKDSELYNQTLLKVVENEIVEGVVTAINKREVVMNIGAKSEGVMSAHELPYNPELKVGGKGEGVFEAP